MRKFNRQHILFFETHRHIENIEFGKNYVPYCAYVFQKNITLCFSLFVLLMYSCGTPKSFPGYEPAQIAQPTPAFSLLKDLPRPNEPLVAAVYSFRDQTGQYKPSETGANWSTAVTQGATSILMRAMEESGWFVTVERENVNNLLNERKIIRSSQMQYQSEQESSNSKLPPLLFAGLILEGGIISYDANIQTGGMGLRYFGAGGSTQYRQDRVTVCLRAIATTSGKVVKTVYTSKTILSQAVDGGMFRFVSFKRLLEAETGYTANEPADIALTEAIEKALQALILEGISEGLMQPKYPEKAQKSVQEYFKEKSEIHSVPPPQKETVFNNRIRFGVGGTQYRGDYPTGKIMAGAYLGMQMPIMQTLKLEIEGAWHQLESEPFYSSQAITSELNVVWNLPLQIHWRPYLVIGSGILLTEKQNEVLYKKPQFTGFMNGGVGLEIPMSDRLNFDLRFNAKIALSDKADHVNEGKYHDSFFQGQLGLNYRLK